MSGSADQLLHLTMFGKPAETFLGKYQPAVDPDFIYPAGGGDQFDIGIVFFLQFGFQPGSTRLVISCGTVFDGYFHHYLLDWSPVQNDPGCFRQRALL